MFRNVVRTRLIPNHRFCNYSFHLDSNPPSMDYGAYSLPLRYLTRNCHKMTNCEQIRTKCCVKIAATLALGVFSCLFDKNVTRMLQKEEILSVLKNRRKRS